METLIGKFHNFLAWLKSAFYFSRPIEETESFHKQKTMEYGIGGTERKIDVGSESIAELSMNKTLFIQKLTDEGAYTPEMVSHVQTMGQAFEYFKPSKEISFVTDEGVSVPEVLQFRSVGDFGPSGITSQSVYLNEQKEKADHYRAISKELKSNKAIQTIISNPETKEAFLSVIKTLISDLEAAN